MDPLDAFLSIKRLVSNISYKGNQIGYVALDQDGEVAPEPKRMRISDAASEDALEELQNLFLNLSVSKVFCCGGNVDTNPASFLVFKNEKIPFCKPAPFGDLYEQKTVIDKQVRDALECDANRFSLVDQQTTLSWDRVRKQQITSVSFVTPSMLQDIIKQITSTMCPQSTIDLVPYKLNIYAQGGFFKEHVDTPIDKAKMIGTLVICLPYPHEGGELVVRVGEQTMVFDFSAKSKHSISWAAFFSDCLHEVKPVTSGYRITVTYNIIKTGDSYFRTNNKAPIVGPAYPDVNDKLRNQVRNCLSELAYAHVGLFLTHRYTFSGLKPQTLKGNDAKLYSILHSLNTHQLTLLPIFYERYRESDEGDESVGEKVDNIYSFTEADLAYLRGQIAKPEPIFEDIPFIITNYEGEVIHKSTTKGEYQGNWSDPDTDDRVYVAAALIISKKKKQAKVINLESEDEEGEENEEESEEEEENDDEEDNEEEKEK